MNSPLSPLLQRYAGRRGLWKRNLFRSSPYPLIPLPPRIPLKGGIRGGGGLPEGVGGIRGGQGIIGGPKSPKSPSPFLRGEGPALAAGDASLRGNFFLPFPSSLKLAAAAALRDKNHKGRASHKTSPARALASKQGPPLIPYPLPPRIPPKGGIRGGGDYPKESVLAKQQRGGCFALRASQRGGRALASSRGGFGTGSPLRGTSSSSDAGTSFFLIETHNKTDGKLTYNIENAFLE